MHAKLRPGTTAWCPRSNSLEKYLQARISPARLTCRLHGTFMRRYPTVVTDAGRLKGTSMRGAPVRFLFVALLCVGGLGRWGRRALHAHETFPSLDRLVKAARLLLGSGLVRGNEENPPGQKQDL